MLCKSNNNAEMDADVTSDQCSVVVIDFIWSLVPLLLIHGSIILDEATLEPIRVGTNQANTVLQSITDHCFQGVGRHRIDYFCGEGTKRWGVVEGFVEQSSDGWAETKRGGSGPERVGGVSSGGALVMVCLLAHGRYLRISEHFCRIVWQGNWTGTVYF